MTATATITLTPTGAAIPADLALVIKGEAGSGEGGGATDLAYTASPTGGAVTSSTGTDATLPLADGTNAGLMAPAQHSKLAGIAAGATANATDAQLRDRSAHTGTQAISTVTGLQTALDGKEATGTAAAAVAAHEAAADPHPAYRLESDTTDAITEGSTNLWHTAARVRAVVLTGLSTATNAAIEAADTVLAALGKLQAQITANLATLTGHTGNTSNPHSTTAAQVGAAASGAVTTSGLTMATARILGRSTASTGAVEEISIGSGLSLSGGTLSSTASGGSPGGSSGQVQYNSSSSFAGSADLAFNDSTKVLTVGAGSARNVKLDGPNGKISFGYSSGSHGSRIDTEDGYPLDFYIGSDRPLRVDYNHTAIHYNACYAFRLNAFTDSRDAGFQHDTLAETVAVTDGSGTRTSYRDIKARVIIATGRIDLPQYTTATRPTLTNGALIFDSDLDKALIGGASAWEVVTSS